MTLDEALERVLVATCEAQHLSDLRYRWSRRFGERVPQHIMRLEERRRAAIGTAEHAASELAPLWDHDSRALPPLTETGAVRVVAYIGPGGGEISALPGRIVTLSHPPRALLTVEGHRQGYD